MGQMTGLLALMPWPMIGVNGVVNAISRCLGAVGLRRACITAYSAVSLCLALNQLVMFAGCDGRSCRCCPVWGGLVI